MSSKKMRILLLVLIGLLAVSTVGYLIADNIMKKKEAAEAEEAASLVLFCFDSDSVDKVTFDTSEGFFQIEYVDSVWTLTDTTYPYAFALNTYYINTVCSYLAELTAEKKFDIPTEDLADYGLDDPVVLTCYIGSTEYTLYVGSPSATQEYFYVMVPGDDTVYGISYDYGVILYGDTAYLKNSYMINENDVDVEEISLVRDGSTVFELAQEDGAWIMTAPLTDANVNSAQANSMVTALVRLELETFITNADENTDLSVYQLDDPAYTLTVKNTDGEVTVFDFSEVDENSGVVYLINNTTGQIATMDQSTASFLQTQTSELLSDYLLQVSYSNASALEATVDDISFTMTMDHENGVYTFDDIDISDMEDVLSTSKSLFNTVSNLEYEELVLDAQPDIDGEPDAVFRYTLLDGTETELSLYSIDDTTYWAFVDGSFTHMTVRRRSLSSNSGVLNFYEKVTDALADAEE